jgi:hypothetical protein
VRFGRVRGVGGVDRVDGGVCRRRAYGATDHVENLGLLEVDVQWGGLLQRGGSVFWLFDDSKQQRLRLAQEQRREHRKRARILPVCACVRVCAGARQRRGSQDRQIELT